MALAISVQYFVNSRARLRVKGSQHFKYPSVIYQFMLYTTNARLRTFNKSVTSPSWNAVYWDFHF